MTLITGHEIFDPAIEYVVEANASAARKWADENAQKNATLRLLETAKVIRDSMSVADQPSLHARLRSDIEGLIRLGLETTP
jgi:hypothetical protein